MSLASNLLSLVTRTGTEFKALRTLISGTGTGNTSALTTTATSLVGAVNEVKALIPASFVLIDDAVASLTAAYSSTKTDAQITAAVNALVDLAPGALDTLGELATQLAADESAAGALTTSVSTLTTNVGDTTTDFVAAFNAAIA